MFLAPDFGPLGGKRADEPALRDCQKPVGVLKSRTRRHSDPHPPARRDSTLPLAPLVDRVVGAASGLADLSQEELLALLPLARGVWRYGMASHAPARRPPHLSQQSPSIGNDR